MSDEQRALPAGTEELASRLTLKQRLFVEAYLGRAMGDATQAAKIAGYNATDRNLQTIGSCLKYHEVIAQIISARVAEYMDSDEVLTGLTEIARRDDRDLVQVVTDHRGNVVEAKLDVMPRIRAYELIGKAHGLFNDRQQVDVNVKAIIGVDLSKIT
jgi:phage terminase small subunit